MTSALTGNTDVESTTRGRVATIAIAFSCIVSLVFVAWLCFTPRFDSIAWKASDGRDEVRIRMVDDLLRRYDLVGMTELEVQALLGPPRDTPYFSEYDFVYLLGPERSFFGVDSEWLCLNFSSGIVTETRVLSD